MSAVVQCVVSLGVSGDKCGCHYVNVILKCEICCTLLGLVPSLPICSSPLHLAF